MGRRRVLMTLGLGAVAGVGLAACGTRSGGSSPSSSSSAGASSPPETGRSQEGPDADARAYPGGGSNGPDVLDGSGIVRGDIRSSFGGATGTAEGVPMTLELDIKDLTHDGKAFAGVAVYVWHSDREGRYSMYSDGVTNENYL